MAAWAKIYTESKSRSKRNFGSSTIATRRASPAFNCTNRIVSSPRLLNDLELLDALFVDTSVVWPRHAQERKTRAGQLHIHLYRTILRRNPPRRVEQLELAGGLQLCVLLGRRGL